jgi:hypothetical protein
MDGIAVNNGIGAVTASHIISEFKKGIETTVYESIEVLTMAKEGITLNDVIAHVRLNNLLKD